MAGLLRVRAGLGAFAPMSDPASNDSRLAFDHKPALDAIGQVHKFHPRWFPEGSA